MSSRINKYYVLISFSIVFGWIMSLPYEGPVMYALAGEKGIDGVFLNTLTVFFHFAGLFTGRFMGKSAEGAKRNILICSIIAFILSLFIPFVEINLWFFIIPMVSLLTGMVIAINGTMIKGYFDPEERSKTVADILIYGNIVLIAAHIFANNTTPMISYIYIEAMFLVAIILIFKINTNELSSPSTIIEVQKMPVFKTYWILFLFIFIITINSGIMFQVIYPYFGQFETLVSVYTNIPYIGAIFILSRTFSKNKFYFLYIGLALWAMTFILFSILGQTPISFIIICTIMLTACGIFDLFWWSVMADNFQYVENPASLFGLGLSLNVLGVWIGGLVGNYLMAMGMGKEGLSYTGIIIVVISMLIILPLNGKLSQILDENEFIVKIKYISGKMPRSYISQVESILSNREMDVFSCLIMGKTDTQISKELHISTHTIKTHNRNIYRKLRVSNRAELIKRIAEEEEF